MRFEERDKKEFEQSKKRSNLFEVLTAFAESEMKCVEILDYKHQSPYSCAAALKRATIRYHMYNIDVRTLNGRVYMIKKM